MLKVLLLLPLAEGLVKAATEGEVTPTKRSAIGRITVPGGFPFFVAVDKASAAVNTSATTYLQKAL